jgi:hypothetical protein
MARIRTIKPEFPQSESIGRLSRDARLTFILLWTLADDSGRLRGSSRMLASLLYPYDDDAGKLMDVWLAELDLEGCTRRYKIAGDTYVEICNWLKHQKIDKPSASKIPQFDESSRILSNPREHSSGDQGSRKGSRTKDQEGNTTASATPTEFEQLKAIYPKRSGDQGWSKALKACHARLKEGSTWQELADGSQRYADYCATTGKTGTEFVKQAATFFGPDKHFLNDWVAPPTKGEVRQNKNINAALEWLESSNG